MYLFHTQNFDKSLSELQRQQKEKEKELNIILKRYRDKHGNNLQGVKIKTNFDPNSDLGKLVLGGKASLHKDCLDPVSQILVAQSVYLRVEIKELIRMKSTQHVLEKRKTIDEFGVSCWIQQKRKKILQLTKHSEHTTGTGSTVPEVKSEPHNRNLPAPSVDNINVVTSKCEDTLNDLAVVCTVSSTPTQQPTSAAEAVQTEATTSLPEALEKLTLKEILSDKWQDQTLWNEFRRRRLNFEEGKSDSNRVSLPVVIAVERIELWRLREVFNFLRCPSRDWRCMCDTMPPLLYARPVRPAATLGPDQTLELPEEIFYPDLLRAALS